MRLLLLPILLLVASASLASAKTLDQHVTEITDGRLVGAQLPAGFDWIIGDAKIQAYIVPSYPATDIFYGEPRRYTYALLLEITGNKVKSLTKGEAANPAVIIAGSADAALRIFESADPLATLKSRMAGGDPRYRSMDGLLSMKIWVIKTIGILLAIFSPDFKDMLPLLEER
ncbi:MAG: hypothetical protein HY519_00315 [Candidatus Aenigmarchaeota archaeon]|nr:hypothetical protein [Candidatus Aenigmarchaeota archaeon]